MADDFLLTRAFIEAGGIDALIAQDAPDMTCWSEAERTASLHCVMQDRPPGDVWLFGYGSLIWNPTIINTERRVALIQGWHRAFCLSTRAGRGSIENPGLVLGLEPGGSCVGVALRIAEAAAVAELTLLWRREMLTGAYVPHWVDLLDEQGARFGIGLAFTVNPAGDHYAGDLPRTEVVRRLATATGSLGSAADYLFRTCDALRLCGVEDRELERLAADVLAAQSARGAGAGG
jgi:glutathione-specific gamma-glutamylcyclotransferase